ncbi:hypothetical protein Anas_09459 [Armadillidium nasatum]|uniref:Uncharacterized protein n=1 Tax=Armadillidium nasatum TaxID=96803 RepID=A0A5N5TPU0_9CRUS|nr:hypothetical protein Anas_09459 [Armadillidium nasatum]
MEKVNLQKELLKVIHCFKGPVHQAFVYTYYQSYTQNTDMYTFAVNTNKSTNFSSRELHILELERRPIKLNTFLLYKVLQNCCMPVLSDNVDPVWSYNDTGFCTSKNKIEEILASVISSYRELLFKANKFSIVDFNNIMDVLLHNVCLLIEKSAEISKSRRWTEEKERLETIFSNIRKGDFLTYSENCTDIIRIESEFRADLVEHLLWKEIRSFDASFWDLKVLHQCQEEVNPKDM